MGNGDTPQTSQDTGVTYVTLHSSGTRPRPTREKGTRMTIAIRPAAHPTSPLGAAADRLRTIARRGIRRFITAERPQQQVTVATDVAAAAQSTTARTYRVRHGDTTASIAIAHGLSAASLLVRNGMRLRDEPEPGTTLIVSRGPGGCRAATQEIPVAVRRHEVRDGEHLEDLSARFHVSPRILLTANGLASASCLTPGVTIVIPTSTNPLDTGEIPVVRDAPRGVSANLS